MAAGDIAKHPAVHGTASPRHKEHPSPERPQFPGGGACRREMNSPPGSPSGGRGRETVKRVRAALMSLACKEPEGKPAEQPGQNLRRRSTWCTCSLPAGSPRLLGTARPQTHSLEGKAELTIRALVFAQCDTVHLSTAHPSPPLPPPSSVASLRMTLLHG